MTNGSGITPTISNNTPSAKPAGQVAQIVTLPKVFQINPRGTRVEGEVSAKNHDGSTRIKTSEGDVDVSYRGKDIPTGTKVELDIPQGSPPRSLTIRTAQSSPTPTPQIDINIPTQLTTTVKITTPPIQNPFLQNGDNFDVKAQPDILLGKSQPFIQKTNEFSPQTPLPKNYQASPVTTLPATPILTTGQMVRLTPISIAQSQAIFQEILPIPQTQALFPNTITSLNFGSTPKSTIEKIQIPLTSSQTITEIKTTPLSLTSSLQETVGALDARITPQNVVIAKPVEPSLESGILPNTTIKNVTGAFLPLSLGAITDDATLIKQFLLNTGNPTKILTPLDVKIIDIKPMPVTVLPPTTNNVAQQTPISQNPKSTPSPVMVTSAQSSPSVTQGTVVGFTPQNLPVINIQFSNGAAPQSFALQFPASNLSVGMQILLTPQPNPSGATVALSTSTYSNQTKPFLQALPIWPVMDDIFQTLTQTSPQTAASMARILPNPANGGMMGSAALLFIAALRSGDIGGWLNEKKIEILNKVGKENLLRALSGEASDAISQKPDDKPSEWRSYPLPLLWQNEISKVIFHLKNHGEEGQKNDKDGSTRFIMDISLTRMGDVQLDGLLKDQRLDLIVRTQMPISHSMQDDMKRAYANALDGTNIYGELGFQGDIKSWVNVLVREEKVLSNA